MIGRLLNKIWTGGRGRRSRFHDERGNRIDFRGLLYLPHCVFTTLLRVLFGYRPRIPWLGYRAVRKLDKLLDGNMRTAEFGSGMSTLWLARRCSFVVSIESDESWYRRVLSYLAESGIENVDYRKRDRVGYADMTDFDDGHFDFILIDGIQRAECARSAVRKVRHGGYIYLDNSDKHAHNPSGDTRIAERILLQAARERGGSVEYFVDFLPTCFVVNQGLLVRV